MNWGACRFIEQILRQEINKRHITHKYENVNPIK